MWGEVGVSPHPQEGHELRVGGAEQLGMLQEERVPQGQQHGALTLATRAGAGFYRPRPRSDLRAQRVS